MSVDPLTQRLGVFNGANLLDADAAEADARQIEKQTNHALMYGSGADPLLNQSLSGVVTAKGLVASTVDAFRQSFNTRMDNQTSSYDNPLGHDEAVGPDGTVKYRMDEEGKIEVLDMENQDAAPEAAAKAKLERLLDKPEFAGVRALLGPPVKDYQGDIGRGAWRSREGHPVSIAGMDDDYLDHCIRFARTKPQHYSKLAELEEEKERRAHNRKLEAHERAAAQASWKSV